MSAIAGSKKARCYWSLIKSPQTGLLLATGLAGYFSVRIPANAWPTLLGLVISLTLAIGGSTVLNMAHDADIDSRMKRTCWRPLPSGQVSVREAAILGSILSALGVSLALAMSPLYGTIVFAGLFLNLVIYTLWLKRRTPLLAGGVALAALGVALARWNSCRSIDPAAMPRGSRPVGAR